MEKRDFGSLKSRIKGPLPFFPDLFIFSFIFFKLISLIIIKRIQKQLNIVVGVTNDDIPNNPK